MSLAHVCPLDLGQTKRHRSLVFERLLSLRSDPEAGSHYTPYVLDCSRCSHGEGAACIGACEFEVLSVEAYINYKAVCFYSNSPIHLFLFLMTQALQPRNNLTVDTKSRFEKSAFVKLYDQVGNSRDSSYTMIS